MNWLNALSSPVAGATYLAGAIYAGSVALERGMRKDALQDIAAFINRRSVVPDLQIVTEFTYREFRLIFGDRHFSFKCIWRSIIASIITMIGVVILIYFTEPKGDYKTLASSVYVYGNDFIGVLSFIVIFSLLPDYISLWKGRLILRRIVRRPNILQILFWWVSDVVLSVAIWTTIVMISFIIAIIRYHSEIPEENFTQMFLPHSYALPDHANVIGLVDVSWAMTLTGTVMTSIWTALAISSCLIVKIISSVNPLLRAMRWAFDVEAHPVAVLGRAAAALVWTASLTMTLL